MSRFQLRSWQRHNTGRVMVTVVLDPPAAELNTDAHRGLAARTERLIATFNRVQLPATWGVSDPVHAAATSLILPSRAAAGVDHELAILGDSSWVGAKAGRPRFAKELARRVTQARAKGIACSTLLLRDAQPGDNLDLIVKRQITALCPVDPAAGQHSQRRLPRTLHYGLWEFVTSAKFPVASGWFAKRKLLRQLTRAAGHQELFHLVVDAPALGQREAAGEKLLAAMLTKISQLRDRGHLDVETLAGAAARLSDVPTITPQRSILRLAA